MANTITNLPAELNLTLFRDRDTVVELTVSGNVQMPASVDVELYYAFPGKLLPTAQQPIVSVTGRVIRITLDSSLIYPSISKLLIRFDDKPVLFGSVVTGNTTRSAATATPLQVSVNLADTVIPIALTVVAPSLQAGAVRYAEGRLEYFNGSIWTAVPGGAVEPPVSSGFPYSFPFALN